MHTFVFFPGGRNLSFLLGDTTYHNNSLVNLEDTGEGDKALLCKTDLNFCCNRPNSLGSWFYPNGTRVPSRNFNWDFYRGRGSMMVRMNRREGGVDGIYCCKIPDARNVFQTIYIGVYNTRTGEWHYNELLFYCSHCSLYDKTRNKLLLYSICRC